MRIAIINSAYHGGGAERVAREMFHWLRDHGHGADMYVGAAGRAYPPGVRTVRLPAERYLRAFEPKGVWRDWRHVGSRLALRRFPARYDLTHVHNPHGGYLSLRAVHRLCRRMPVVWSLHDEFAVTCGLAGDLSRVLEPAEIVRRWGSTAGLVQDDGAWGRYREFVARWMPRPAALVCHSEHLLRLVRACPEWRDTPAHLVRIPVPLQHEASATADRAAAKARFGLAPGERVVLMVASHFSIPYKGIPFGVDALRELPGDAFRVLLIGAGAEAIAARIPQASICPGAIRDTAGMAWAYRAADVTLVPSVVESFGLVAAESLACETPVAAFRVGGLVELTGDGARGLLAAPGDVGELAGQLRALLDDPELRGRLGAAGRAWVAANCDAERSFEQVLAVYGEAVATFNSAGLARSAHP
jgi:glycosyltransferase involved in cell wall biosynthesis